MTVVLFWPAARIKSASEARAVFILKNERGTNLHSLDGIVESTVGVTEGLLEMDDSLLLNVLTCSED